MTYNIGVNMSICSAYATSRRSCPERRDHLADEIRRNRIVDAEDERLLIFRHMERPEHQIPQRQAAGEIRVAAFSCARVMPAVKRGAREHIFQRSVIPSHIRMQHDR